MVHQLFICGKRPPNLHKKLSVWRLRAVRVPVMRLWGALCCQMMRSLASSIETRHWNQVENFCWLLSTVRSIYCLLLTLQRIIYKRAFLHLFKALYWFFYCVVFEGLPLHQFDIVIWSPVTCLCATTHLLSISTYLQYSPICSRLCVRCSTSFAIRFFNCC